MRILSLLVLILLAPSGFAQDGAAQLEAAARNAGHGRRMDSLLKLLGDEQEQGLRDYLSVIGVEINPSLNTGITRFNESVLKSNSCFRGLASEFYADIRLSSEKLSSQPGTLSGGHGRHSLADQAVGNYPPGWLWQKALTYAQGNKLMAMQLIGLCGHDDIGPSIPHRFSLTDDSVKRRQPNTYMCPPNNSAIFAPGSLGSETIVPARVRDRIVRVQAPTMGATSLPAKYYHTIGAAYTSCFMIRRGVPDFVSSKAVKGSINAYRASRICGDLAESEALAFLDIPADDAFKQVSSCSKTSDEPICAAALTLGGFVEDNERGRRKFRRLVASARAMMLYKRQPQSKVGGSCDGMQLTEAMRDFFEKNGTGGSRNPCPRNLPANECADVRQVMATWAADFERDEAQHMAGYNFARQNCPKLAKGQDPLANACPAFASAKKIVPAAATAAPESRQNRSR